MPLNDVIDIHGINLVVHPMQGICNLCYRAGINGVTFTENNMDSPLGSDIHICEGCCNSGFIDRLKKCSDCGRLSNRTTLIENNDHFSRYVCYSCRMRRYFTCMNCSRVCSFEDIYRNGEELVEICPDCTREYVNCDSCGTPLHHTAYYTCNEDCEQAEDVLCLHCVSAHNEQFHPPVRTFGPCAGNTIIGHNPGKYIDINWPVGLEIEVEQGDLLNLYNNLPPGCGAAHDGSLYGGNGVEIQTPPLSLDTLEDYVYKICSELRNRDFKATKRCSIHVNISATQFRETDKLTNLINLFYSLEDIIFSMLPPSRWTNHFCARLSSTYSSSMFSKGNYDALMRRWYQTADNSEILRRSRTKYDGTRYVGLNLHALYWANRIEFRYHSGTIVPEKILQWTNMILRMSRYAASSDFDNTKVAKLRMMSTSERKMEAMFELMDFPDHLREYIRSRVNKFNPGLEIKFSNDLRNAASENSLNYYRTILREELMKFKTRELGYLSESESREVKYAIANIEKDLNEIDSKIDGRISRRFLTSPEIKSQLPAILSRCHVTMDEEEAEVREFA